MIRSGSAGQDMSASPPLPPRPSWFAGKRWFWAPIAPLVALDLWSKSAAFALMATVPGSLYGREYQIFETAPLQFSFVTWWNTGTIWGLGQGMTEALIGLRCCALVLILYFARRLAATARLPQLVLGMIMAGAIGNLYDNFTQERSGVRDFLRFKGSFFGTHWEFPAFNVADSCICIGAFSLAFILWRSPEPPPEPRPEPGTDSRGQAVGADRSRREAGSDAS